MFSPIERLQDISQSINFYNPLNPFWGHRDAEANPATVGRKWVHHEHGASLSLGLTYTNTHTYRQKIQQ